MAGLRRVGKCDLDRLRTSPPSLEERPEGALFTNLFGGSCVGLFIGADSIGAAEPFDNCIEGESGPTLDRGLLFEGGKIDNRFIQEPLEDIESLRCKSSPETSCAGTVSPDLTAISRLPPPMPELFVRIVSGCW